MKDIDADLYPKQEKVQLLVDKNDIEFTYVRVLDFDMKFNTLVFFILKSTIASIPTAILISAIISLILAIAGII